MAEQLSSALARLTACLSAAQIEATARRTGVVPRTSKITGTLVLPLSPCGSWRDAQTTLAPLAAKATPWGTPVVVSPEALSQRMNKRALTCLRELICPALATRQCCAPVGDESLVAPLARGHVADRTGWGLPARRQDTGPGAGGRAAQAGATIPLGWDDHQRVFTPFARMPWNMPDQQYSDTGVARAQPDDWWLFAVGYFTIKAWAQMAAATAYGVCRRNHQATLWEAVAGRLSPVAWACRLAPVKSPRLEQPSWMGAQEQGAARLSAARVPEEVVKARRRLARKNAKPRGETPSHAHVTRWAWHLFITHGPETIGQTAPVLHVSPRRWPVERLFTSCKSALH
jgi:hypothetical protein